MSFNRILAGVTFAAIALGVTATTKSETGFPLACSEAQADIACAHFCRTRERKCHTDCKDEMKTCTEQCPGGGPKTPSEPLDDCWKKCASDGQRCTNKCDAAEDHCRRSC